MRMLAAGSRIASKYGYDTRQIAALFWVYLKQDLRGGKAFMQPTRAEYLISNWALLAMLGIYMLVGLGFSALVFTGVDVLIFTVMGISYTLLIVVLSALAESVNVILNEPERDVLGHLPVSPRTHFAAKVLNLVCFTLVLTAAANLFPAFSGAWAEGSSWLFTPFYTLAAGLAAVFGTSFVAVSYGLLMRYVSKERFDNIVAYSQAALAVSILLGYQLLPYLLRGNEYPSGGLRPLYFLYPPAWFSAITMIGLGRVTVEMALLAVMALISLALVGGIALRRVSASYSSATLEQAYGGRGAKERAIDPAATPRSSAGSASLSVRRVFRAAWLRNSTEAAVFDMVGFYLRRNREIKVRLYPSFAYFLLLPLIAVFDEGLADPFVGGGSAFHALLAAAMIVFVALTAIEGLAFSEHYHAAYIFRVAPVRTVGEIHGGVRKAVLAYVVLPAFGLLAIIYTVAWGSAAHALLTVAPWIAVTPTALLIPFSFREILPLARRYQKGQQSARNIGLLVVSMAALSVVAAAQVLALNDYVPYWAFLIAVVLGSTLAFSLIRRLIGESRPVAHLDSQSGLFGFGRAA